MLKFWGLIKSEGCGEDMQDSFVRASFNLTRNHNAETLCLMSGVPRVKTIYYSVKVKTFYKIITQQRRTENQLSQK